MLRGEINLKGDKSISHRVLILAAMSREKSIIYNLSNSIDVQRTINILKDCGIRIRKYKNKTTIIGISKLKSTKKRFYCGNSGTTARLMLGFLPTRGISGELYGDKSLSKRPMKRVISPLIDMNIKFSSKYNNLPIKFKASKTKSIKHTLNIPSAQVKTALIFSALSCSKESYIKDPFNTRDHTERLINYLGFNKKYYKKYSIEGFNYTVSGDISSAAFLITAALLIPKSNITINNLIFNKTRRGYIEILKKMGAKINIINKKLHQNEIICDLNIQYTSNLRAADISQKNIVSMIDEIPILSLVCAYAHGTSNIRGAQELRYKESDRINSIVSNFKKLNININEYDDGFSIIGPNILYNTTINPYSDHRIALMGEIIRLINKKPLSTNNKIKSLINTSFPEFYSIIEDIYE